MELLEQIQNQLKTAMKNRQETKLRTLRMLNSALKNSQIEKRRQKPENPELNEDEVINVIKKQVKQRKDSIAEYEKAGRDDLAEKERQEVKILEEFLPKQLAEEEIKKVVQQVIDDLGAQGDPTKFGAVMGQAMNKLKGQADGNRVSATVKELLG